MINKDLYIIHLFNYSILILIYIKSEYKNSYIIPINFLNILIKNKINLFFPISLENIYFNFLKIVDLIKSQHQLIY